MDTVKRYYSVEEASELLIERFGKQISVRDVLDLVVRGSLRLCFWFEGDLAQYTLGTETPTDDKYYLDFKGYIQIPISLISFNAREFSFRWARILEVVFAGDDDAPCVDKDVAPFLGTFEETGHPALSQFCTSIDLACIPAVDLSTVVANTNSTTIDKPLATKERNS